MGTSVHCLPERIFVHYQYQTSIQADKSDYLGQLIVTREMVVKKIKSIHENKSPGGDGIRPKLLMETG